MGKIQVENLARLMGVDKQDLVFKLKSIGVRVEGDDAHIDTDVLQAFLQGKSLPQPREVMLRDGQTLAQPQRRTPPPRRMPSGPQRPGRRRPMIQRVEPRIRTLESSRPAAVKSPPAEPAGDSTATAQPEAVQPATAPATAPKDHKKPKRGKRPIEEPSDDLRSYRGSVKDIEAAEAERDDHSATVSGRGKRRAARKREDTSTLVFKESAPEGPLTITDGMTVREFSDKLGVKSKSLIELLFKRGMVATINHVLQPDQAEEIAEELGVETMRVSFEEEIQMQQMVDEARESSALTSRAPIVTIMGHVDHGKTTLLDVIRSSKVTESEFGGITQHIGAYQVEVNGKKIVFLDTPGHEAFTMMRARGASITDIVVLVVAADDGVMPQTLEAIDHAKAAEVPIVVAINKIDKANANPDRVRKELSEHGLTVEQWGGDVVSMEISALQKQGVPELLEMILLSSDILELQASPELLAAGVVVEARKEPGRGIVATVLVQDGTLSVGDIFVSGATWGKVRSMSGDLGTRIQHAEPATPVEVTGFNELPGAGDPFQVVDKEAQARSIAEFRQEETRKVQLAPTQGKMSLEQLFGKIREGEMLELPVVLKADVQGSLEVLTDTFNKLATEQVRVNIIRSGVGAISTNDILLASASGAIVFGFNVRPERKATDLAEKEEVDVRLHTVIYQLNDEIKQAMIGLLSPTYREVSVGRAEVRELFKVPKIGQVAGSHVVEGVIPRNSKVRLLRDNRVIFEGRIASLRRFKDDASEVRSGFDCGIGLEKFHDFKPGDSIEAYAEEEIAPTL